MIEFYVSGQRLKYYTPVIAADSLNYLTAKVNFTGDEWDGYSKWLHFRQDEELGADTYDLQLNKDNEITAEQRLNLSVGQWEIYLTGTKDNSRLTTVPVIVTVQQSGLIDAPLHELPMSVAEQVDFNARQALLLAQSVKDRADAGGFDGRDGKSFVVKGFYANYEELRDTVTQPEEGDTYGVGQAAAYSYYIWDAVNAVWRDNGSIQGVPGERGEKGATFIPSLDANGNLSWNNDGGLENPTMRNIRGPAGPAGEKGADGKSPYELASEKGYTGTEATFNAALTNFPYHNARHLPEGADPIRVQTGNIEDGAVTRAKLAQDALYSPIKATSTATEYYFVESDLGKTVMPSSGASNSDIMYVLSEDVATALPYGAEIAVVFRFGKSLKIKTEGAVYSAMAGDSGQTLNRVYQITDRYGMVALKKINYTDTYTSWLVTGNVEVVS